MRAVILCLVVLVACGQPAAHQPDPATAASSASAGGAAPVVVTVVGTNDLHGHLEALPVLAGYIDNLREARAGDGGVVLVDGGDMFQGTLASNLGEGAAVVEAYEAIGYDAVAVGNHEFDFGPAGEEPTPDKPGDDPQGALKARMAEADFPFVASNLGVKGKGRVGWDGAPATATVSVRGVSVGIIGVSTTSTPYTTIASNFAGLEIWPLADTVAKRARELREGGADVVVVTAHAGSACREFDDPDDLSSCETDEEAFELARDLPRGAVDVIVGGHTHAGVAHRVNGIAVIEAYARGVAFGRVDVSVRPGAGEVADVTIHPPRSLCPGADRKPVPASECEPGRYAGAPVEADAEVAAVVAAARKRAEELKRRPLRVTLSSPIERAYGEESALGNLFADLMREARPEADVAITNGGGLRADLPSGPLTYGELYRAMPFDNRFAMVAMRGRHVRELVRRNLRADHGILSVSGLVAEARCEGGELAVSLRRPDGEAVEDDDELVVATSDFLASGGDGAFGSLGLPDGAVTTGDGATIRDAMAKVLERRGGELTPADVHDPERPRLAYPDARPVDCGG